MNCQHCGTKNSEFAYKCVKCGKELSASTEVYKQYDPIEPSAFGNKKTNNKIPHTIVPDVETYSPNKIHTKNKPSQHEVPPEIIEIAEQVRSNLKPYRSNSIFSLLGAANTAETKKAKNLLLGHFFLLVFFHSPVSIVGIILSIIVIIDYKNDHKKKAASLQKVNLIILVLSIVSGMLLKFNRFF